MSGRQDSWMPLVNIENPFPPCLSVDQYREPMDNMKIIGCATNYVPLDSLFLVGGHLKFSTFSLSAFTIVSAAEIS